jgi:hypothetical protein
MAIGSFSQIPYRRCQRRAVGATTVRAAGEPHEGRDERRSNEERVHEHRQREADAEELHDRDLDVAIRRRS